MDVTAVRQISNADGSIYLFDLYNEDGDFNYKPCLVFEKVEFDSVWDSEDYLLNFFRRLKKNKKEQIKELKTFCKENKLDFEQTFTDLIDIYKTSKVLGFWKKEVKCRECGGTCKPSKGLVNFHDLQTKDKTKEFTTKLLTCLKCEDCGHSFTLK